MNPQYPGNQGQMPPTGYGQPPIGQGQRPPGPPQNMHNGQSMNQFSGQPGIYVYMQSIYHYIYGQILVYPTWIIPILLIPRTNLQVTPTVSSLLNINPGLSKVIFANS
jgi:hypothetical protein